MQSVYLDNIMSVFSIVESAVADKRTLPEVCRNVIKGYIAQRGLSIKTLFDSEFVTFYFLMTQDCNMHCPFCYQPKEFRIKKEITKKTIDESMEFILSNFDERKVRFSIFGGEPLLTFDLVKYLVDGWPMLHFVLTTNGLLIKENEEIRDWVMDRSNNLNLSVSIGALREVYKNDFIREIAPCLAAVKKNGGDVHYVIKDPEDGDIFSEIQYLFEYGIPMVRLSAPRHWELTGEKVDKYIELFKKVADYVYFGEKPMLNRMPWDTALRNNIYKHNKGRPISPAPPTFCGCGTLYLAIDSEGDIYPCDFFANFPEFKLGSIRTGFNENAAFFRKMKDWVDGLYEDCKDCYLPDIRLCPRSMCLAENYLVSGNPLKPAPLHCEANKIEYALFDYISKGAIERGLDKL